MLKDYVEMLVYKLLLECKDLLVLFGGSKGDKGIHGSEGDHGKRGERGVKGEKGIQSDNSDVQSVMAEHLPIQLATRYGEKMCFIKYHVSEDKLSIIELSQGVVTLRSVSTYHETCVAF